MTSSGGGARWEVWNLAVLAALGCAFCAASLLAYRDPSAAAPGARLSEAGVRGKRSWHARNCVACHQIYGLGGYLGPDLTDAVERLGEPSVAWVLRNGRGGMPRLGLPETEIADLVVYLREVAGTGTYPPRSWPPGWWSNPPVGAPAVGEAGP